MATIVRGTLWFGLYVFLALLPLGTAIAVNPNRTDPPLLLGLAIGAGFVGLSLMALEFALISRVSAAVFLIAFYVLAQIFVMGAVFTRVYASMFGSKIVPTENISSQSMN